MRWFPDLPGLFDLCSTPCPGARRWLRGCLQQGELWAAGTGARRAPQALQAAHKKQRHPRLLVKQWGTGTRTVVSTDWGERQKQFSQSPVSSWAAGSGLTRALGRRVGFPCTGMGVRVGSSSALERCNKPWGAPRPGASL